MTDLNGHRFDENDATSVADEIRAMAAQIKSATVSERVNDGSEPFEQKSHDLMLASVDKITQAWVDEMVALRENSKHIEQMVLEQAAKVKAEMTRLHLLGVQAMRETQRGHEVLQHLGDELDSMISETRLSH
jgi:hypothetical protein